MQGVWYGLLMAQEFGDQGGHYANFLAELMADVSKFFTEQ